jgi:hypothetical protein
MAGVIETRYRLKIVERFQCRSSGGHLGGCFVIGSARFARTCGYMGRGDWRVGDASRHASGGGARRQYIVA